MVDPVRTLVGTLEAELSALPGAVLRPRAQTESLARLRAAVGEPPPGLVAFLSEHDGGRLGESAQLLSLDEAAARHRKLDAAGQRGLWPVLERSGRLFALDAEASGADGEWPVVEVADRGVDRVGTSFLRFLQVTAAELSAAARARERRRRRRGGGCAR